MSLAAFTLRLVAALGAGILIGAERQFLQRMAGLRTIEPHVTAVSWELVEHEAAT